MLWFGSSRPVLFQTEDISEYIRKNFSSDKITNKRQLCDFFQDMEGLMKYRRFFKEIEDETQKTAYKITFKHSEIKYFIDENIINEFSLLNSLGQNNGHYPENYIIQKKKEIVHNLAWSLSCTFLKTKRTGVIMVNDKEVGKFEYMLYPVPSPKICIVNITTSTRWFIYDGKNTENIGPYDIGKNKTIVILIDDYKNYQL